MTFCYLLLAPNPFFSDKPINDLNDCQQEEEEEGGDGHGAAAGIEGDPTYELASARRNIVVTEPLSRFIENSRKMFLLQVGRFSIFRIFSPF